MKRSIKFAIESLAHEIMEKSKNKEEFIENIYKSKEKIVNSIIELRKQLRNKKTTDA